MTTEEDFLLNEQRRKSEPSTVSVVDVITGKVSGFDVRHKNIKCDEFLCLPERNWPHYFVVAQVEPLNALAKQIALDVQAITGCSDNASQNLASDLTKFAEEIIRRAVEP